MTGLCPDCLEESELVEFGKDLVCRICRWVREEALNEARAVRLYLVDVSSGEYDNELDY